MTVTEGTAEFGVFCPGVLDILSIGRGHIKLMIDNNDEDREKAKALIEEMLRKGYSIFVETDKGPVAVKRFNPKRMTYLIADPPEPGAPTQTKPARARKAKGREVPVAGSKATAVGRTAGG